MRRRLERGEGEAPEEEGDADGEAAAASWSMCWARVWAGAVRRCGLAGTIASPARLEFGSSTIFTHTSPTSSTSTEYLVPVRLEIVRAKKKWKGPCYPWVDRSKFRSLTIGSFHRSRLILVSVNPSSLTHMHCGSTKSRAAPSATATAAARSSPRSHCHRCRS